MNIAAKRGIRAELLLAASLLALAAPAGAQTTTTGAQGGQGGQGGAPEGTPGDDSDVIVVTGFRASLESALRRKENSNLILESVTAEDIGKFPDQNVTESLQRLPGVQIDRENGQGTTVLIRGLRQNATLLNSDIFLTGLEIFKVGEGNDQRGDSLEGVPAELIGGIDVYKSPNAALVEGGLGGTIDIRTRKPLSLKDGLTVGGNVRATNASGSGKWTPIGAIVAGYKFNDRFAVQASFSYDQQDFHTNVLGGQNRGNWRFAERGDAATVTQNYYAPEYRYVTDRDQRRERYGASFGAEFKATDALTLGVDYLYSRLRVETLEASLKFPFTVESPGLVSGKPYSIDDNGVLLSGTLRSNSAEAISLVDVTEVDSHNVQGNLKWDNGGRFRVNAAVAYAQANQNRNVGNNDVRYTQYSVPTADPLSPTGFSHQPANPAAPANFDFTYTNGAFPSFAIDRGPADLFSNPNYGYFKSHWAFGDRASLENYSGRVDVQYDAREGEGQVTFSAGFRYAERKIDYTSGRYLADYSGKGEVNAAGLPAAVKAQFPNYQFNWTPLGYFQDGAIGYKSCELPSAALKPPQAAGCNNRFGNSPPLITPFVTFNQGSGRLELINNFAGGGHVQGDQLLVQSREQMLDAAKWIQALYPSTPFAFYADPLQSFRIKEETKAGYVMMDWGGKDDPFHVNVGLRIVNTSLKIDQNQPANADPVYFGTDSWNGVLRDFSTNTAVRDYTDFLPSLNAWYNINEMNKARFSVARVVARQDLFALGRGFATDFTRNPTTNLFEFTSGNSGNPNLEPYRATQFDLSLEHYFGRQGLITVAAFWKDVESFIVNDTVQVFVNDQAGGRLGPVSIPVNGQGGTVRGIEVGAQYAFRFGLGFNVNYTYSDSTTNRFTDFDRNLPIPGVSRHSFNSQVYYEHKGLEARLSYSWRSEAYNGNFSFRDAGTTRTLARWFKPYGQLDGQISYQLTPNFGLLVQGINLLEANQAEYLQFKNLPFTYASGARRVLLGGRLTF